MASGAEIRQAVKSKPWPSRGAVLRVCGRLDKPSSGGAAANASLTVQSSRVSRRRWTLPHVRLGILTGSVTTLGLLSRHVRPWHRVHRGTRQAEELIGQDLRKRSPLPLTSTVRTSIHGLIVPRAVGHQFPGMAGREGEDIFCPATSRFSEVRPERMKRKPKDKRLRELWWNTNGPHQNCTQPLRD